ncbi:SDR family NAD(P)-dependent oxidoreductase [Caldimonas brevitalea]|nr:SDR family oxidoreductase [Caldimonas brevitalea]
MNQPAADQDDTLLVAPPPLPDPGRRRMLGSAAAGTVGGLVAGLAGGVALAQDARQPALPPRVGPRRFDGKVVLVTGGTSGIGRAAVWAFAAEGARVSFCGRRDAAGQALVSAVTAAGGEAHYQHADVLNEGEVRDFVNRTVQRLGRLDIAFNNAGISIEKPLHEFGTDEWDRVQHTNVRGVFLAMKYELPHMMSAGGGVVLVTSSIAALGSHPGRSAYSASKRALLGLVQGAALDYARHNIRINALLPGTVDTPLVRGLAGMTEVPDAMWQVMARQWAKLNVPGQQRMATAEEIAAFALALCSDDFPYMTGSHMVLDGGKTSLG